MPNMPIDAVAQAHWISATQIGNYELCPRKWGFYKLEGIKPPPNKYAVRGSGTHKVLEAWLERGEPIDTTTEYGRIAAPGVRFLPPPKTGETEERFTFSTDNAVYVGFWDLWVPPRDEDDHYVSIYDHKTTSDFKWMKTGEDLKGDPQAVIYTTAAIALSAKLGVNVEDLTVYLKWVYYRANANNPGARLSQLVVMPDGQYLPFEVDKGKAFMAHSELDARFQALDEIAAQMVEHHRQGCKATDLPYNTGGCGAYGGCPYRGDPCQLTTQEIVRGLMTQENLAEKMRRKMQENKDAAPADEGSDPLKKKLSAAKPAASEASPDIVDETSKPPAVNPPESDAASEPEAVTLPVPNLRIMGGLDIAQGIVAARLFDLNDPNYPERVGHLAVEVADAVIKAAAK